MNNNKSFLSGTLSTLILSLLKQNGKMYGYEICMQAKNLTDDQIILTEGAIYPALHKLEKKGIIRSTKEKVNGRTRKYYAIAKSHSSQANEEIESLYAFTHIIQSLLKPSL
jgi:DNA-binding PadR family transcriptional regulator